MKNLTQLNWLHRFTHLTLTALLFLSATLWLASCDDEEEPDTIAPEVSFPGLTDGTNIFGVFAIQVNAEDDGGIEKIEVYANGTLLQTITAAPYEVQWDTNPIPDGSYAIKAVATDRAGNSAEQEVTVAIKNDELNDNIAPVLEITSPSANATVWASVNVTANVTDNRSISKVEFLVDGNIFNTINSAPFSASLNTATLTDGSHIIKVIASDKANNKTEKQVTVTLKNTLISITVPADQLFNENGWTERGFVFLSDADGKLITSAEFQNSQELTLKSETFSGETFSLTQVRYSTDGTHSDTDFWTYTGVARGNWVLMKEIPDDEEYAGDVNLTFTNPAAQGIYHAVGNGDDEAYVDPSTNTVQTIRLQKSPSKLYVRRSFESGTPAPGYRLYPNIAIGNAIINLNLTFTPLARFDYTMPSDLMYMSVDYHGYADTQLTEHYDLGYTAASSGVLSVYKPTGAFAAYWSEIELESGDYNYFRTSNAEDPTSYQLLTYTGSMNYANNKLTYDITGDKVDFVSTSYYKETNETEASWAFVGPKSATGSITIPELPDAVKAFPRPVINGNPPHFTIYDISSLNNYSDFLSYVRTSMYGIDELYQDGKEAADMSIFQDATSGGRAKRSSHRDLRSVTTAK
jgi:hypothetical protein